MALVPSPVDGRLFVVEQRQGSTGRVRFIENGSLVTTPLLSQSVSTGSEQGLLGVAFHPNFAQNRFVFINFTDLAGATFIARMTVNADLRTTNSNNFLRIWRIPQPYANHNGGTLAFGADGYLYVGMGDGGSANDPQNLAQTLDSPHGKFFRLDVDRDDWPVDHTLNYGVPADNPFVGKPGLDEAWTLGWRNPWKWSIDERSRGGLDAFFVGDVGQSAREEISVVPANGSGGMNFGWRVFEGVIETGLTGGTGGPYTPPIYNYNTSEEGCAITGGYVYRGVKLGPEMYGRYVFGDYCNGWIRSIGLEFDLETGAAATTDVQQHESIGVGFGLMSFGIDHAGELYVLKQDGTISRIDSSTPGEAAEGTIQFSGLVDGAPLPNGVNLEIWQNGERKYVWGIGIEDGSFRVPRLTGEYQIAVQVGTWLRRVVTVPAGGAIAGISIPLINGDIDGSNAIDLDDYFELADAFRTAPGDPGWNPRADLDRSGFVDLDDYFVLADNFRTVGD